jgi:methyl-accepting chemotaxis protein
MRESDGQSFICAKEKVVGKRKRKKEKKPVLTSPWKIGMMVALLLTATSFGVGYYMVRVYEIELYWLSSDVSRWVVDSYEFFKEIYPAAAGVVLLSLFTYFVIASAVRRYKYYLDSGQDYRKMISIADSIDDLTNPAQIARLSDYPELQEVLRNYGDQLREISEGMERREQEMLSVDLEVEIDSILDGNGINETLSEGKWWASIARKVHSWVDKSSDGSEEMRKQSEATRKAAGRASLMCGRVIEIVASADEDIQEIAKAAGELSSTASPMENAESGTEGVTGPSPDSITAVESAAAELEEKGSEIHDLSEESNGLALNMALMAARGETNEKDLAQLAEKVRSTAERFSRLGKELKALAGTVAESTKMARSATGLPAAAAPGIGSNVDEVIGDISSRIEMRSRSLQQKMTALSGDVEEIGNALGIEIEKTADADDAESVRADSPSSDGSIVNFGGGSTEPADELQEIDDSDLVIDHGKMWGGSSDSSDAETGEEVTDDSDEFVISGFQEEMSAVMAGADERQQEEPSIEETGGSIEEKKIEETIEEVEEQVSLGGAPDVVEELFAQESGTEIEDKEQQRVEPEEMIGEEASEEQQFVDHSAEDDWENMQGGVAGPMQQPEVRIESEAAEVPPAAAPETSEQPDEISSNEQVDEGIQGSDEEPVYDLFELGAVEYVEETEMNL